jgi:hypothetical protein
MKYVRTYSSSIYEIDEEAKKIRRLHGIKDPTPRQGNDGDWKDYKEIIIALNKQLIIVWGNGTNANGEAIMKTTATSSIEAIGDSLNAVAITN